MSDINQRIKVFSEIGGFLRQFMPSAAQNHHLNNTFWEPMQDAIAQSKLENGWFTTENIHYALAAWGAVLQEKDLLKWIKKYNFLENKHPKKVAVIMAGNLPLVGFHDFLSVLLSGHQLYAKLSREDKRLLPMLTKLIEALNPELAAQIHFVEKVENPDAVIATGSNNSARYFEHYFGKYPHIIRKNRTSAAVLTGSESDEELILLGEDIFRYFGLGCRNVSKLYIPNDFDLNRVFGAILPWSEVVNHHKYANNYDYYRAIYLLNKQPFLENGFVLFVENSALNTPVSVVHYERYSDVRLLRETLALQSDNIQCVVGNAKGDVSFSKTQQPALCDYADGVDTLDFLQAL